MSGGNKVLESLCLIMLIINEIFVDDVTFYDKKASEKGQTSNTRADVFQFYSR